MTDHRKLAEDAKKLANNGIDPNFWSPRPFILVPQLADSILELLNSVDKSYEESGLFISMRTENDRLKIALELAKKQRDIYIGSYSHLLYIDWFTASGSKKSKILQYDQELAAILKGEG